MTPGKPTDSGEWPRFPPQMPALAPLKKAPALAEKPNPALRWKAKVFDGHGEAGGGDKTG
jgi:hypothetical protein